MCFLSILKTVDLVHFHHAAAAIRHRTFIEGLIQDLDPDLAAIPGQTTKAQLEINTHIWFTKIPTLSLSLSRYKTKDTFMSDLNVFRYVLNDGKI